ncbi:MAG: hypothetical protein HZB91_15060 [Elusimicrobia bacterium]|nr:hypothetical protein [Elusimicrobiota bacterium]
MNDPRRTPLAPVAAPGRWREGLAAALLVLLYVLSVGIKVRGSVVDSPSHLPFDSKDETGYFWTESAFQYRYARMAAQGLPLPKVDTRAQYPEGLVLDRGMTVLMEPLAGWLHRNAAPRDVPPHLFAVLFLSAVSSLSLFAVFLLVRLACGSSPPALAAAVFYVFNPASSMRVVGSFEYESFSLPMFFLGLALFSRAVARARSAGIHAAAAGLLLVLSLLSWHFSSFLVFGFMFLTSAYAVTLAPEDAALGTRLKGSLLAVGAMIVAAGLAFPSLLARMIPASWLAVSIYSFSACAGISALFPKTARSRLLAAYLALTGAGLLALGWLDVGNGMYGHVHQLIANKLRFLLSKPADPSLLTFDGRSLWLEAFESPSPGAAVWLFAPAALVLACWGLVRAGGTVADRPGSLGAYRYCAASFPRDLLLLLGLFSCGLYLLVDRLSAVLVFFAAALPALCFDAIRRSHPMLARAGLLATLLLGCWQTYAWDKVTPDKEWLKSVAPFREGKTRLMGRSEMRDAIDWFRRATDPDDPVLAAFQTSPMILTYADRPILLHPKFEDSRMRGKVKEFLDGLYGPEQALHAMARRYGAKYFLYQTDFILDTSPDSPRYMADRLVLPPGSAALSFQFFPERLRLFELVHQNLFFRVFKVRETPASGPGATPFRLAWYDPVLFGAASLGRGPSPAKVLEVQSRIRSESRSQEAAAAASESGDFAKARGILSEALPRSPHPAWLMADFGAVEFMAGDPESGILWFSRAVEADPFLPYARKQFAIALFQLGRLERSYQEAKLALRMNAEDAELHGMLGFICQSKGDYRQAVEAFQKSLLFGSRDPQVRQALDSSLARLAPRRRVRQPRAVAGAAL